MSTYDPAARTASASARALRVAIAAAILGVSFVAAATTPLPPPGHDGATPDQFDSNNPADVLVQSQVDGFFSLVKRFDAPIGLTGYLLASASSQPVVVYSDPAGTHLFVGAVIGADGENIAMPYLSSYMDEHALPALFDRMAQTAFLEEGSADAPLLYVVFDPRCPHCADLHTALAKSVAEGRVAVRWVPVDVLGDEPLAARVLDARDAADGTAAMTRIFEATWSSEAIAAGAPEPSEQNRTAAAQNAETLALLSHGGAAVPQIFYLARSGSFQIARGSQTPDELELIIKSAAPNGGVDAAQAPSDSASPADPESDDAGRS